MRNSLRGLLAGALFLIPLGTISASPIAGTILVNPGDTVFPGLIASGTAPGTLLASLVAPFTSADATGNIVSAVFRNSSGTLDFYFQVVNSASSTDALARETDINFSGFLTWFGFRVDGASLPGAVFVNGTVAPVTADRNSGGNVVGFSFNPPDSAKIAPGQTSNVLVVSTNAVTFKAGTANIIDGSVASVATFAPATVPEPATTGLIGIGLLFVGVVGFRRNRES